MCQALKDELTRLGVEPERIVVLRNGVDLQQFRPLDRARARAELDLDGKVLLSVGHLTENKGNHLTLEALARMPGARLLLVGEGPQASRLRRLARALGVSDRVRFEGHVDQPALARYYSATDALVLASRREGWANVLLESMACGTPVVATGVWGTPEVVTAPEAGILAPTRCADGLHAALEALFARYPDRAATRRYAERFSWQSTSEGQLALFRSILEGRPAMRRTSSAEG